MYMDLAKPPVAWKLVSAASRMCLDMGLHRQPPNSHGPEATKQRVLFWFAYACDKGLALNFGRTPNIHDYDITIERPRVGEDLDGIWGQYYFGWIDYAELQGDILEQLFSARAQLLSQEIRTERALALGARLQKLADSMSKIPESTHDIQTIMKDALLSIDVTVYALQALIYRCIPPKQPAHPLQFCDECISASRAALNKLVTAWEEIKQQDDQAWRMFINWTLLFVPFVPFIVVFGTTIAQSSRTDLALLERVVDTLNSADAVASGIEKLRSACSRFLLIAQAYLSQQESNNSGKSDSRPQVDGSRGDPQNVNMTDATVPNQQPPGSAATGMTSAGAGVFDSLPEFPFDMSEWDLGLGAENAREMGSFFGQYAGTAGYNQMSTASFGVGF